MSPGETVFAEIEGKKYSAYLATPPSGSGPAVIVIQEWWGLVPHVCDIADRFAAEGFLAIAPDFYGGEKATEPEAAGRMMMALQVDHAEFVLNAAIEKALSSPACTSKTAGVVGFCMGGQLALYAATLNPKIAVAVDFYGIHPNVQPDLSKLNGLLLGFFAERDGNVSKEVVDKLDDELNKLEKPHQFITYPDTDHAFFNDTRPSVYNQAASEDAWNRMLTAFRERVV